MANSNVSFTSESSASESSAIEVAAMLGDSVVHVKHCVDPRGGKITPATWGLLAGGLACLLASAAAFYVSVDAAASNQRAFEAHTHVQHKPVSAFRPHMLGPAVDWVAFGGLALGLAGLTGALARARGERKSPYYRIGTAPGVEQPVEHAPAASFPLVAPSGDDFVLNYGAGMTGELIIDGRSTSFAELVATGRAQPSVTTAGAFALPIPAHARIRATAGQTTFVVSAVGRPRHHATPLLASLESRTMKYIAGSLVAHLGIWMVLQQIPADGGGVAIVLDSPETTGTMSTTTMKDDAPIDPEDRPDSSDHAASAATAMKLSDGAPQAAAQDSRSPIENSAPLSREEAIAQARQASILGSAVLQDSIASLTAANLQGAFDDVSVYDGEHAGHWFGDRSPFGMGGGCIVEPCGLVASGPGYRGLGVNGRRAGDGYWAGGGRDTQLIGRAPVTPEVRIRAASVVGDLDKAIIKRYVRRAIEQISYCYEHELLARPGLEGTVTVQFLVSPTGAVASASATGFDPAVSSCVAGVVKAIQFPRPSNDGNVQVTYPFTFRAAGR